MIRDRQMYILGEPDPAGHDWSLGLVCCFDLLQGSLYDFAGFVPGSGRCGVCRNVTWCGQRVKDRLSTFRGSVNYGPGEDPKCIPVYPDGFFGVNYWATLLRTVSHSQITQGKVNARRIPQF